MGPENRAIPAQETRGGDRVDWARAVVGEPLPELPPDDYPEPDSTQLPSAEFKQQVSDSMDRNDDLLRKLDDYDMGDDKG